MASTLKKWGYVHNERVFCYKVFAVFIIYQDLSFGGFALKIEFVVFVYELFSYEIIFLLLGYICNYLYYSTYRNAYKLQYTHIIMK